MLNLTDCLKYETKPKIETITAPYDGVAVLSPELKEEIAKATESLIAVAGSRPSPVLWEKLHYLVKAGPFGLTMLPASLDAVALEASEVWKEFQTLCKLTLGTGMLLVSVRWFAWVTRTFLRRFWSRFLGTLPVGKISQVIEPRGKMKLVTIPGYWVQSLLRPLHMSLYNFLRKLLTDHTFNQEEGVKRCMASEMKTMHSFDLSTVTDWFPIWFEEEVLANLLQIGRWEVELMRKYGRSFSVGCLLTLDTPVRVYSIVLSTALGNQWELIPLGRPLPWPTTWLCSYPLDEWV